MTASVGVSGDTSKGGNLVDADGLGGVSSLEELSGGLVEEHGGGGVLDGVDPRDGDVSSKTESRDDGTEGNLVTSLRLQHEETSEGDIKAGLSGVVGDDVEDGADGALIGEVTGEGDGEDESLTLVEGGGHLLSSNSEVLSVVIDVDGGDGDGVRGSVGDGESGRVVDDGSVVVLHSVPWGLDVISLVLGSVQGDSVLWQLGDGVSVCSLGEVVSSGSEGSSGGGGLAGGASVGGVGEVGAIGGSWGVVSLLVDAGDLSGVESVVVDAELIDDTVPFSSVVELLLGGRSSNGYILSTVGVEGGAVAATSDAGTVDVDVDVVGRDRDGNVVELFSVVGTCDGHLAVAGEDDSPLLGGTVVLNLDTVGIIVSLLAREDLHFNETENVVEDKISPFRKYQRRLRCYQERTRR